MNLEDRFREKIKAAKFSILELIGFKSNPTLALMAGMDIGYKMGIEDAQKTYRHLASKSRAEDGE